MSSSTRQRRLPGWMLACSLLLSYTAAGAQDEVPDMVTDRPDQTESTTIVAPGSFQLETGIGFSRFEVGDFELDTLQSLGSLVRVGLIDERLELRIGWSGFLTVDEGSEGIIDESGIGDASLGVKVKLRGEDGKSPGIAILASGTVPVGDDAFTSDEVDPDVRVAFSHTLSDRFSLGYNVGATWSSSLDATGETTTLSDYLYTLALGIGVSDRVGAFVELFGTTPGSSSGSSANSFDGGFTFLLRDNLQLDLAGGVGLSDAADDWFAGVGVSVRFPR